MSESTTDPLQLAGCPLCGTTDEQTTYGSLGEQGSWLCARCGQRWTLSRLASAAAYAAWVADGAVPPSVVRQIADRSADDGRSRQEEALVA